MKLIMGKPCIKIMGQPNYKFSIRELPKPPRARLNLNPKVRF